MALVERGTGKTKLLWRWQQFFRVSDLMISLKCFLELSGEVGKLVLCFDIEHVAQHL